MILSEMSRVWEWEPAKSLHSLQADSLWLRKKIILSQRDFLFFQFVILHYLWTVQINTIIVTLESWRSS